MIRRTISFTLHLTAGLGIGLALAMGALAWRLSTGPISLEFINPYIEKILSSPADGVDVDLGDTILTWAGWDRNLDLRVVNVRLTGPSGQIIGAVPELSLSLSAMALLRGQVAPKTIHVFSPRLRMVRDEQGRMTAGFGDAAHLHQPDAADGATNFDIIDRIFADILAEPDPGRPLSYLTTVRIEGGDLTVDDRITGISWRSPATDILLTSEDGGLSGEASLAVTSEAGQIALHLVGAYDPAADRRDFMLDFADVNPKVLAKLVPGIDELAVLDVSLEGTVGGNLTPDWQLDALVFDLTLGEGSTTLPEPLAGQTLRIDAGEIRGSINAASGDVDVTKLSLTFSPRTSLHLPAPVDHAFALASMSARGSYRFRTREARIEEMRFDLGGPVFEATLNASRVGDETVITARAAGFDVPVSRVAEFWPASLGTDAYAWITAHMADGAMRRADLETVIRLGEDGGGELVALAGTMELEGVTVDYLPPMPKATGVTARARFDGTSFDIELVEGVAAGQRLKRGLVLLSALDGEDPLADIDLELEGELGEALALIDSEPLGFTSALGIDPARAKGTVEAGLKLHFPLENDLTFDRVGVAAEAQLRDAALANAVFGLDLSEGALSLSADKEGMDLGGTGRIGSIPVALRWRQNFTDDAPFRSRYWLDGIADDAQIANEVGLSFPPFTGGYVKGPMAAQLLLTRFDGRPDELTAVLDLEGAFLSWPLVEWIKPKGIAGSAEVDVKLDADRVLSVSRVAIRAGDLDLMGSVAFETDGRVAGIRLDRLTQGRNDLRGILIPNPDGSWDADVHGTSFDIEPWRDSLFSKDTAADGDTPFPAVTASLHMDRVWLGDGRWLDQVTGAFSHDGAVWRSLILNARLSEGKRIRMLIEPKPDNLRSLYVSADDAGEVLRILDIFPNMLGGTLELSGTYDDNHPDQPLRGEVTVENYRVAKAPVLAEILSFAAMVGVLERLGGEGILFQDLIVPFESRGGVVTIRNARATGASLGVTAAGTLYTDAGFIDIEGTIVPAYALNALLGNIPLIGGLLSGGEKGGGLFAFTYQVTGDSESPSVVVNPLSALAPGVLRNIFRTAPSPTPE